MGISQMQVTVDELVPSRAVAMCLEASTGRKIEVRLLPMRVARVPQVGERWLIDRVFGPWAFSALLTSPDLFQPPPHVGEAPPNNPKVGQRWVQQPAKVWNGAEWVDE